MITYELAKELKAAGFPQDVRGSYIYLRLKARPPYRMNDVIKHVWVQGYTKKKHPNNEWIYAPTLSELIDSIPTISSIRRTGLGGNETWSADTVDCPEVYGLTPEIAVAKLWLALNTK